jgi:DNA-binding SARP family transcriptional activator
MDASGLHEEAGAVWGLREPAAVDVQLAGRIQIHGPQGTLDGATLGGRRAQIAFARLALGAGHTVSRDLLADAIWDEYLPASWVPALRNVIASVRRWLNSSELGGSIALSSVGDGYRLEMPVDSTVDLLVLASDTERAEEAARGGDHAAALRFAQDALARASSPMFEGAQGDWVEGLRAHVSELRMRLQRVSGQTALALGDVARAERVARQLIATAPLREDAHRLLMSALYAAGNRGEALSAYDTCRRLLADELGAMPSQPTEALFLEILAEDRDQRATSGAGPSRRAVGGPLLVLQRQTPFVGRGKLLEDLRARLGLAVEAGPLLVSVSGAPGMGKTRLAAELAALAHAAGMSELYGRADDRIAVPYGSLLEALEGGFVAHDPHEAAARLGDHGRVMGSLLPSLAAALRGGAAVRRATGQATARRVMKMIL